MSDDEIKMPASKYMESKREQAKNKITEAFDEFKFLVKDKTHPDNQTAAYKKRVSASLQKLFVNAEELDNINPGEGIFGLFALSLNSILAVKNENIKLEKEVRDLKLEIKRLQKR